MAQLYEFDQLNNIRSEPIEEYWEDTGLSEERIERRKEAAYRFFEMMIWYFLLLELGTSYEDAGPMLADEYMVAMAELGLLDERLATYAPIFAEEINRVTREREGEPYFTSEDRARIIAENEASGDVGWEELREAIEEGYTMKTWHGVLDKRERETHVESEGQTVGILDYFNVGAAQLLYPRDETNGAEFPEEVINCRCFCTFS